MSVPSSLPLPTVVLPEGGTGRFASLSPDQQSNIDAAWAQFTRNQRELQETSGNWAELRREVDFCRALNDRIRDSQAQLAQGIGRYAESIRQLTESTRYLEEQMAERSAEGERIEQSLNDQGVNLNRVQVDLQALQQNTAELQRRVNNLTALSNEAMEAVRRSRLLDNAPPRASSFLGDILDAITDGFSAVGGFLSSLLEKVKSLFSCGG